MKLAIIGTINPNLTYKDWVRLFRHHFWKKSVSEFRITGGDTLLNSYAKTYASEHSIPISLFCCQSDDAESKSARNDALIDDADLVVAFTTTAAAQISRADVAGLSCGCGKDALVIFADEPLALSKPISTNPMPYCDDTCPEDLLTVEEEVELVRRIQSGEGDVAAAQDRLLRACLRFVKMTALKYVTEEHPLEELIAEGNKGLLQATRKFDPSRGFKFITYAIPRIRQAIEQTVIK